MSLNSKSAISIRVDPTNPGQFFACCGMLELADRLWDGAEGWFGEAYFHIQVKDDAASLPKLLMAVQGIRLLEEGGGDSEEEGADDDSSVEIKPLIIASPFVLRLDWWKDKSLKTWAGSMDARKIFLAMCSAIVTEHADPLNYGTVVFDPSPTLSGKKGNRKGKSKKREPFYFDARRGSNAWSIDVGFSPDSLEMTTIAYPAVEALSFIGLQRCRPKPTETPRVFDYFTWHSPLPVATGPVAVFGLAGNGNGYRFENAFRTDQRKHKAFNPATPIQRS